jgi:hypothetical protein
MIQTYFTKKDRIIKRIEYKIDEIKKVITIKYIVEILQLKHKYFSFRNLCLLYNKAIIKPIVDEIMQFIIIILIKTSMILFMLWLPENVKIADGINDIVKLVFIILVI